WMAFSMRALALSSAVTGAATRRKIARGIVLIFGSWFQPRGTPFRAAHGARLCERSKRPAWGPGEGGSPDLGPALAAYSAPLRARLRQIADGPRFASGLRPHRPPLQPL